MKKTTGILKVLTALAASCTVASVAFADFGGREDNSSLVVWSFLGFCALIVIAQVLPAIRDARRTARLEKERRRIRTRLEE